MGLASLTNSLVSLLYLLALLPHVVSKCEDAEFGWIGDREAPSSVACLLGLPTIGLDASAMEQGIVSDCRRSHLAPMDPLSLKNSVP